MPDRTKLVSQSSAQSDSRDTCTYIADDTLPAIAVLILARFRSRDAPGPSRANKPQLGAPAPAAEQIIAVSRAERAANA
jgi:hypothetical protein